MNDIIIIKFKGGLGNQMFQYALYYRLKQMGKVVKADLSNYSSGNGCMPFVLQEVFPHIGLEFATDEEVIYYREKQKERRFAEKLLGKVFWKRRYYTSERENGVFDKRVFQVEKGFLDGYWQSEKYFKNIRKELLEQFCFRKEDSQLHSFVKGMLSQSVALHVRRGDYLNNANMYGNICTVDYYERAMQYFYCILKSPVFYVFSDDMEWARNVIKGKNVVYVEKQMFSNYFDWYDLFLMSSCKHNIIANSSFSWWGAWLNTNEGQHVITPGRWLNGEKTKDIWCENWEKV